MNGVALNPLDPTRVWLAPVVIEGRYGLRYDGKDYLVYIEPLARALFRDWRNA